MTTTAPTPEALFTKIDGKDLHGVTALLAEDATMSFGNGEPLVGREAILAANTAFMETIAALRHRIVDSWVIDDTTIAVTEVTYTRLDMREVTLPAVTIWRVREDGLIVEFRVVLDLAPLYAS
ncbi:nuclear transport factor 2 family protein [Streptomyces alboflavus]|uniref:nuclear transport factor 2 family protein n=1 Tax=Streptomyces alboflavus TaxID=67267 RepID=UPI0004BFE548|nr:nuclear transport factor 2 family protein [Streptomyces alboflavus]